MQKKAILLRPCLLLLLAMGIAIAPGAQAAGALKEPDPGIFPPVKKMYDEEARTWYAISCAGGNLYVYLTVTDLIQQRKIVMNGIELWIDTKGKKNKKTGIIFPFIATTGNRPLPPPPPGMIAHPENSNGLPDEGNANMIASLEKLLVQNREMKLSGFKEGLNGVQNIHHPSGIHVSMYFLKDTLVYLAQLPLNTLSDTPAVHSRMAVGLVEKGMSIGTGGDRPSPDAGGDGMMPPPGPPPGEGVGMRIFDDNTIWYRFLLQ